jgi:hypothetical protein
MNRIRVVVPFLASVVCLFISACATSRTVEDTIFADGPRGAVLLQRVDDAWFKTTHPVSVSPLLLTHVLRGVQVQAVTEDQTTGESVFSDEETAFLSPLISTALSKATKNQLVAFRVTHASGPGSEMTGGHLFTRGRILHLWLTHYRANGARNDSRATLDRQARNPQGLAPHQLHFVPETAQRSSHNQQPDVIDPPPLATLTIDYMKLAVELAPSPATVSSQTLPGPTPDPLRGEASPGLSNAKDLVPHDTPSPVKEETEVLKERVREQASELDALKDDVRALRQRLFDMEAHSPQLTAPPMAPARREKIP